jgi:hypothetical protein
MTPRLFSTSLVIAQRNTAWKFSNGKERLYKVRAKPVLPARQAATIVTWISVSSHAGIVPSAPRASSSRM